MIPILVLPEQKVVEKIVEKPVIIPTPKEIESRPTTDAVGIEESVSCMIKSEMTLISPELSQAPLQRAQKVAQIDTHTERTTIALRMQNDFHDDIFGKKKGV